MALFYALGEGWLSSIWIESCVYVPRTILHGSLMLVHGTLWWLKWGTFHIGWASDPWTLVGDLGDMAFLEEVCHWGQALRLYSFTLLAVCSLCFSASSLEWRCELCSGQQAWHFLPCYSNVIDSCPCGRLSPYTLFLWQIALVMMFYQEMNWH